MSFTKKTLFYSDPVNDDFAATNGKISVKKVGSEYRYLHTSPLWKAVSFILYRLIATPLVYIACKVWLSVRVKGRKNLRSIKTGFFFYGNHTQNATDAYLPAILAFPRRNYVLTGPETVSVPVVGSITAFLGALPLNDTTAGTVRLLSALKFFTKQKNSAVTIYPEAHIWPYCNFIRPFGASSFYYPAKLNLPAVPFVVTYRERKVFKKLHPVATVYIGQPIYPDPGLSLSENRKRMRDACFEFMSSTAEKYSTAEYVRYIPVE